MLDLTLVSSFWSVYGVLLDRLFGHGLLFCVLGGVWDTSVSQSSWYRMTWSGSFRWPWGTLRQAGGLLCFVCISSPSLGPVTERVSTDAECWQGR